MRRHISSNNTSMLEQLCGLGLATGANYVLIPWLTEQIGHIAIAVIISLLVGVVITAECGAVVQRVVQGIRKLHGRAWAQSVIGGETQHHWSSLRTVVYALLAALTILAMLLSEVLYTASK